MTGEAYAQSARIARDHGAVHRLRANRQPFLRVIGKHREAAYVIPTDNVEADLIGAARHAWDDALELGEQYGYRNAQATVLAPTGTIGFMMDCDTTGVEPDIALVKYKKLVGGGMMKIVNQTVPMALSRLGYAETADRGHRRLHRQERDHRRRAALHESTSRSSTARSSRRTASARSLHGPHPDDGRDAAVHLRRDQQDRERAEGGDRRGHRAGLHRRLEARRQGDRDLPRRQQAQPAARDEHRQDHRTSRRRSWSVRCASACPTSARRSRTSSTSPATRATSPSASTRTAARRDLPRMAKEGSTICGLMDAFATAVSLALQYGVPLQALVDKFTHTRFEPQGFTRNPEIPIAKSIVDYIFRWLASRFLPQEERDRLGIIRREPDGSVTEAAADLADFGLDTAPVAAAATATPAAEVRKPVTPISTLSAGAFINQEDAPTCSDCGSLMVRNGACYKCHNCGATSGCS